MKNVPQQWIASAVVVSIILGIGMWYLVRYYYYRLWRLYTPREALIEAYGLG